MYYFHMRKAVNFLIAWLPPFFLMAALFYSSSQHAVELAPTLTTDFVAHKSIHVVIYAALYFLVFRGFYLSYKKKNVNDFLLWALVVTMVYAISDEFHQTFVPTRTGTVRDIFIDATGVLIMYIYIKYYISTLKELL